MMEKRKITLQDRDALERLIAEVENSLKNEYFWLPIKEEARKHFFDDEWTEFYGVFQEGELIAAIALFLNEYEYGESLKQLNSTEKKVAELGRAMVHPAYRGKHLLDPLIKDLLDIARQRGIECVLATIHPENVPSQRLFQKAGLEKMCTYTKDVSYIRDVYVIRLKQ